MSIDHVHAHPTYSTLRQAGFVTVDGREFGVENVRQRQGQVRADLRRQGGDVQYRLLVSVHSGEATMQHLNADGYCTHERDNVAWSVVE